MGMDYLTGIPPISMPPPAMRSSLPSTMVGYDDARIRGPMDYVTGRPRDEPSFLGGTDYRTGIREIVPVRTFEPPLPAPLLTRHPEPLFVKIPEPEPFRVFGPEPEFSKLKSPTINFSGINSGAKLSEPEGISYVTDYIRKQKEERDKIQLENYWNLLRVNAFK